MINYQQEKIFGSDIMSQAEHAKEAMIKWLSHPDELGKPPVKIEIAETFIYDDMTYYILRFKTKAWRGKWYVGVCGGYEGNSAEHCGHVFSEMHEYRQLTAKDEAIRMIEMLKSYWAEQEETSEPELLEEPEEITEEKIAVSPEQLCFVTEQVLNGGHTMGWCYREEPQFPEDSGWRFLAGHETAEYLSDLSNLKCVSLTVMYYLDNEILTFLEAPYGTTVIRRADGSFDRQ